MLPDCAGLPPIVAEGHAGAVRPRPVAAALALLVGPIEAEGGVEAMQQGRVIGIARVLRIELPVAAHALAHVAQDLDGPREQPVDGGDQRLVEIRLERCGVGAEAREDHALVRRHPQLGETMLLGVEIGGIAAHPGTPRR